MILWSLARSHNPIYSTSTTCYIHTVCNNRTTMSKSKKKKKSCTDIMFLEQRLCCHSDICSTMSTKRYKYCTRRTSWDSRRHNNNNSCSRLAYYCREHHVTYVSETFECLVCELISVPETLCAVMQSSVQMTIWKWFYALMSGIIGSNVWTKELRGSFHFIVFSRAERNWTVSLDASHLLPMPT